MVLVPGALDKRYGGMIQLESYSFSDDGWFPNSPLPLLVYRGALPADATAMELRFSTSGWSNAWRNGIFGYHHFHSIAHEVLGIAAGEVDVEFGGPGGQAVEVRAGDIVIIPAGVGHRNIGQTSDLLVVGAYPGGADYDTRRGDPDEHGIMLRNIAAVALPDCDPVFGSEGPLHRLWTSG